MKLRNAFYVVAWLMVSVSCMATEPVAGHPKGSQVSKVIPSSQSYTDTTDSTSPKTQPSLPSPPVIGGVLGTTLAFATGAGLWQGKKSWQVAKLTRLAANAGQMPDHTKATNTKG